MNICKSKSVIKYNLQNNLEGGKWMNIFTNCEKAELERIVLEILSKNKELSKQNYKIKKAWKSLSLIKLNI